MDTFTHALAGSAISDCWFRKRLGPAATPFALLCGALPDIDAITYFMSPEIAWTQHRGYTHAFFIQLLAAPVLGTAAWLWVRRDKRRPGGGQGEWLWWSLLALLCLFAHTLMDLITSWGTMPLLPFSNARISWDIVPIIDVFMTALLAASFVLNRLLRWERVDTFLNPLAFPLVHEHPGRRKAADWAARAAVLLLVVYLGIGVAQNRQAVRIARQQLLATGVEPVEVRALPVMFTYVVYAIAARDAEGDVYNAFYSSMAPKPLVFEKFATAHSQLVDKVERSREGLTFIWYAQDMYVADQSDGAAGSGGTVRLNDRRFFSFSESGRSRFIIEFRERQDGGFDVKPAQAGFEALDIGKELRQLWHFTRYGETDPALQ